MELALAGNGDWLPHGVEEAQSAAVLNHPNKAEWRK